jgi:hypothetical protein
MEVRDLGDRVIAFGHIHARGRESGLDLDSPTGLVLRCGQQGGKGRGLPQLADALEAAGLRE